MSVEPRTLAIYFLRARHNATQQEAIEYATSQFPDSAIAVAQFLSEWQHLRERWKDAKYNHEPAM